MLDKISVWYLKNLWPLNAQWKQLSSGLCCKNTKCVQPVEQQVLNHECRNTPFLMTLNINFERHYKGVKHSDKYSDTKTIICLEWERSKPHPRSHLNVCTKIKKGMSLVTNHLGEETCVLTMDIRSLFSFQALTADFNWQMWGQITTYCTAGIYSYQSVQT